jgi:hypothetical protein
MSVKNIGLLSYLSEASEGTEKKEVTVYFKSSTHQTMTIDFVHEGLINGTCGTFHFIFHVDDVEMIVFEGVI